MLPGNGTSKYILYCMSRNSIIFLLLLLCVLGLTGLYYHFTKPVQVPDVRWENRYNLYSAEADGYKVFLQLIKQYFGEKNLTVLTQIPEYDYGDSSKYVILVMGDHLLDSFSYESDYLTEHVEEGNQVLFLGNAFKFHGHDLKVETNFNYINNSSTSGETDSVTILPDDYSFTMKLSGYTSDTTHDIAAGQINVIAENYTKSSLIVRDSSNYFISLRNKYSSGEDSTGAFYFHGIPMFFSNLAALQPWYERHFNFVFKPFEDYKIIVVQESQNQQSAGSPLEILLANRGLKYAYYTLLLAFIVYVIFESRRILTPLPIIREKENMSFYQIRTIARLHEVHGDNYQLVKKMRENFLYEINRLFQIQPTEKNMPEALAKKSGLDIKWIAKIFSLFEHVKTNQRCSDTTLTELYELIQNFHKKIHKK